ncbi:DUF2357 domain-containing protein [Helicobacter cetorum]|uniref:DUF2357 domain-containing protein n=1 Tax=Helicobacter cetorum TaxID=138563 RepID=UPI000CF0D31B|nr:hypothetical protein [Helicobacter cetorum]
MSSLLAQRHLKSFWNKNRGFDKSVGKFKEPDLFTLLENIHDFNYYTDTYYDDLYYILDYTKNSILHLLGGLNSVILRRHPIMNIDRVSELDFKCLSYLQKQNGRTAKEKLLSSNGKIMGVKRYESLDTHENRLLKKFLLKLLEEVKLRDDLERVFKPLVIKVRQWLNSDEARSINTTKKIIYNNVLKYHSHYYKILKAYQWLVRLKENKSDNKDEYHNMLKGMLILECLYQIHHYSKWPILPMSYRTLLYVLFKENQGTFLGIEPESNKNIHPLLERKEELQDFLLGFFNMYCDSDFIALRVNLRYYLQKKFFSLFSINRHSMPTIEYSKNIFMDIFRLKPLFCVEGADNSYQAMHALPMLLRIKQDTQSINANNTQVLDKEDIDKTYSLSHMLAKEYVDKDKISVLLGDVKKYFSKIFPNGFSRMYYMLPDFVQDFVLNSTLKSSLNRYFKDAKPFSKSILASCYFSMIKNQAKPKDTLIYIEKDMSSQWHITPILLENIDDEKMSYNHLRLTRYPTKILPLEILESESSIETNGFFKGFVRDEYNLEKIALFDNGKLDFLDFKDIPLDVKKYETKIKELYKPFEELFENGVYFLNTIQTSHLLESAMFLAQLEEKGIKPYGDKLPNLSMIYYDSSKQWFRDFVLVDEKSELLDNEIIIDNDFILPKNQESIWIALKLGDKQEDYGVFLQSKDLPYKEDVRCSLTLKYDYEKENSYTLLFSPNKKYQDKYQPLQAKWVEKTFDKNIYPHFPKIEKWDNLSNDIEKARVCIDNFLKSLRVEIMSSWKQDSHQKFYIEARHNGKTIKLYRDELSKELREHNFERGQVFSTWDYNKKDIKSLMSPLYRIFSHNRSCDDRDMPKDFLEKIQVFSKEIQNIIQKTDDNIILLECLASLHKHANSEYLQQETLKKEKYYKRLGLCLGDAKAKWQQEILKELLKDKDDLAFLVAIPSALWRSPNFYEQLSPKDLETLLERLKDIIQKDDLNEEGHIYNRIKLLLGLFRAVREQNLDLLKPQDNLTMDFIKLIDGIARYYLQQKRKFMLPKWLDLSHLDKHIQESPVAILYATRLFLSNDNEASKIKITE